MNLMMMILLMETMMNRDIMIQAGFSKEVARVDAGLCPTCDEEVGPFKDDLSRKEYGISGMCQPCQDMMFDSEIGED